MMIMKSMTLNFDVVVIGAGPAGITASIYLKRANFDVCVIERNAPGGQLNMISEIVRNIICFLQIEIKK